ncbi:YciI family protein [Catenulispora sp. GP43]|uniref:YciI family protein n=1 Tax=Catenulispora sp. GP43 TaxID=3156263 RepID=UPI003519B83D
MRGGKRPLVARRPVVGPQRRGRGPRADDRRGDAAVLQAGHGIPRRDEVLRRLGVRGPTDRARPATVVHRAGGETLTTGGPFAEAREHLGGFYIINADDLDAALAWASRVVDLIGQPIEVRPFQDEPGA